MGAVMSTASNIEQSLGIRAKASASGLTLRHYHNHHPRALTRQKTSTSGNTTRFVLCGSTITKSSAKSDAKHQLHLTTRGTQTRNTQRYAEQNAQRWLCLWRTRTYNKNRLSRHYTRKMRECLSMFVSRQEPLWSL